MDSKKYQKKSNHGHGYSLMHKRPYILNPYKDWCKRKLYTSLCQLSVHKRANHCTKNSKSMKNPFKFFLFFPGIWLNIKPASRTKGISKLKN